MCFQAQKGVSVYEKIILIFPCSRIPRIRGRLQVTVQDGANNRPVENARVRISYTGVPDNVIEEVRTDSSGKTPMLDLAAPPLE